MHAEQRKQRKAGIGGAHADGGDLRIVGEQGQDRRGEGEDGERIGRASREGHAQHEAQGCPDPPPVARSPGEAEDGPGAQAEAEDRQRAQAEQTQRDADPGDGLVAIAARRAVDQREGERGERGGERGGDADRRDLGEDGRAEIRPAPSPFGR